jgi:Electron transfer DM13
MTTKARAFSQHKRLVIACSVPVLLALWWAFRPEKLWINQTVNEPAPFETSGEPQPIFTGRFDVKTGGVVTVFKKVGREEYLRVRDLTVSGDADAHIGLARGEGINQAPGAAKAGLDSIDLGPLKTNQGDQNYDLPATADLTTYNTVVIYNKRTDLIFGSAKLEPL